MNSITEHELTLALQYRGIKKVRIAETEEDRYVTYITMVKEDEEKIVITRRKHAREWASLDRLIKHIKATYGNPGSIVLTLRSMEVEG